MARGSAALQVPDLRNRHAVSRTQPHGFPVNHIWCERMRVGMPGALGPYGWPSHGIESFDGPVLNAVSKLNHFLGEWSADSHGRNCSCSVRLSQPDADKTVFARPRLNLGLDGASLEIAQKRGESSLKVRIHCLSLPPGGGADRRLGASAPTQKSRPLGICAHVQRNPAPARRLVRVGKTKG